MVSKNNVNEIRNRCVDRKQFRYSLRKLSIGVASVLLGTTLFYGTQIAHADVVNNGNNNDVPAVVNTNSNDNVKDNPSVDQASTAVNHPQPSISEDQAASHYGIAQQVNLNQGFKQDYVKTTDTASSLKYASEMEANFNNNTYQSDPVANAEKIDYNHLTENQLQRINQYQITLVNNVRQQMNLPGYNTNMQLINWQQAQTKAQEDNKLWGHHPEYLHGAGEDVGSFLINNQIGKPMHLWTPNDFHFSHDPKSHAIMAYTPIGAILTMDDLQAAEFYTDMMYLFEDDGLEANGHGHNLLDWNPSSGCMVALGFAGYHQDGKDAQSTGDEMFSRFIIANGETMQTAKSDGHVHIPITPITGISQQVIHLVDDDNANNHLNDIMIQNAKGSVLKCVPALPNGYDLANSQIWPTSFDFSKGNLPALTIHLKHHIRVLADNDPQRNTVIQIKVHYQSHGKTIAPDTVLSYSFKRDFSVDEATGKNTIGHWVYVPNSLKQSGTKMTGVGAPGERYNSTTGMDSFNFWIPFSISVKGYHQPYTGLNLAYSLPNGAGVVGGPAGEYTVQYDPDDLHQTKYMDRLITVRFKNDQGKPMQPDAVLAVRYQQDITTYMSGALKGQTKAGDWHFVGNGYNQDGYSYGMKAISGNWNIPASWGIISVNVPKIDGYNADTSGDSTNTNHVPANEFVYPTDTSFSPQASIYEAKGEHTIIYHEIPNFTINVIDDTAGQVIGTTGKLINPRTGGYATVKWNQGIDQNHFLYHLTNVSGVPTGFKLTGNYHHALNDKATFSDIQYPNFDWDNDTKFTGSIMDIHLARNQYQVIYQFKDQSGKLLGQQVIAGPWGTKQNIKLNVPEGFEIVDGNNNVIANIGQQNQTSTVLVKPVRQIVRVPIKMYDGQGNLVFISYASGKIGEVVNVPTTVIPQGWQLYSGQQIINQVVIQPNMVLPAYILTHKQQFISSDSQQLPSQVKPSDLKRQVTRTINIYNANGQLLKQKVQQTEFVRNAVLDEVTGKVTFMPWSENGQHVFSSFQPQLKAGLTIGKVKSIVVDPNSGNQVVNLQYQRRSANIQFVDANGHLIGKPTSVQADNQGLIHLIAPQGYQLTTNGSRLNINDFDDNETVKVPVDQNIHVYHQQDLNKPKNIQLEKTVSRIVHITMPNGHVRTVKQSVKFERTASVDSNGQLTYGVWYAIGCAQFNKVFVPRRHGYMIAINGDLNKQKVTSSMDNQIVNVEYNKL